MCIWEKGIQADRTANANPEVQSLKVVSGQNAGGKNCRECDLRAARIPIWASLQCMPGLMDNCS